MIKVKIPQGFNVECSARSMEARQNMSKFLDWVREMRVPESSIFGHDDLLKLKVSSYEEIVLFCTCRPTEKSKVN